jgi:hypothetical protein
MYVKFIEQMGDSNSSLSLTSTDNVIFGEQRVYDVGSNIKNEVDSIEVIFLVDSKIYLRKPNKIEGVISQILLDFSTYVKKTMKKSANILSLVLLVYCDEFVSETKLYTTDTKFEMFLEMRKYLNKKLAIKNSPGKGEIDALNTLSKLVKRKDKQKKFIFHFCNREYDHDQGQGQELYDKEIDTEIRDFDAAYELIYFNQTNPAFEKILETTLDFSVASIDS